MLEKYKKNYVDKKCTSIGLFREIKKKYLCNKVLYGGCYVHISPSLIFSDVTYIDSFKNTYKFFKSEEVENYIRTNKEYKDESKFKFYQQNYFEDLSEKLESFDVIISQYGGFVGQGLKKYLKKNSILVCNNSHGDASMADFDSDYELIGVYNRKSDEEFTISDKNLNEYLIPKSDKNNSKEYVEKTMKGIVYTKSPSGYIFKKIG
ncbi:MAG: hypothetical protein KC550_00800 [Nanoarchaeota archaeon]|nr:hypothetical protein [Nanoarchaeota archaeon]